MSAGAVLLAVTATGSIAAVYGLALALLPRRAPPAVGGDNLATWSLRNRQVRGMVLFLGGSAVAIGALALWLGTT